jgi:hypothetical protein
MRTMLIAGLAAAAGLGLAATSGASAAPVNGAVIGDLATAANAATTVQYYGGYGYRYGYRPYGYYNYGYRPYGYGYGYRRYGYRYY